jgi:hypothetical protein
MLYYKGALADIFFGILHKAETSLLLKSFLYFKPEVRGWTETEEYNLAGLTWLWLRLWEVWPSSGPRSAYIPSHGGLGTRPGPLSPPIRGRLICNNQ